MEEKSKECTKRYFDNTAKNYDRSHDGKFTKIMYQAVWNQVSCISAQRILDLGCGTGNMILRMQKEKPAEYYGLDLSEKMIEEAGSHLGAGVDLRVGDAEELPYTDHMFDLVVCNASFHHYPKPEQSLAEIRRVLKPGGSLVLGDPTVKNRVFLSLLNFFMKYSNSGDSKIWGKKEICDLLARTGFELKSFSYINRQSFVLRAVSL